MKTAYKIAEAAKVREGFYRHFSIGYGDFYDGLMTVLTGTFRVDVVKFDEWLHRQMGDYEDRGLSMAEAVEERYGKEAMDFLQTLI